MALELGTTTKAQTESGLTAIFLLRGMGITIYLQEKTAGHPKPYLLLSPSQTPCVPSSPK